MSRGGLSAAYCDIDLLVVPSVWYENAPVTIGEAFAHGCPVLASDARGMADLVRHGENGVVFPMGNVTALAEVIAGLARDPGTVERLRAGVRPPRESDSVADEILEIYRAVLGKRVGETEVRFAGPSA